MYSSKTWWTYLNPVLPHSLTHLRNTPVHPCARTHTHTVLYCLHKLTFRFLSNFASQVFSNDSALMPRARKRIQRPFRRRLLSQTVTAADQELCYGSSLHSTPTTNSFNPSHHGLISSVASSPYAPFPSPSTPVVIGGNYNHNNSLRHHYGTGKVPAGSPSHFPDPEGSGDVENGSSPER